MVQLYVLGQSVDYPFVQEGFGWFDSLLRVPLQAESDEREEILVVGTHRFL